MTIMFLQILKFRSFESDLYVILNDVLKIYSKQKVSLKFVALIKTHDSMKSVFEITNFQI